MNIIKTDIPDVLIFEPRVFGDARGFFFESFSSKVFNEAVGRQVEFVQDNHSQSQKGVLRGPTNVEKLADDLWLGVKGQSNREIAGSPRKLFR
ncbi:dTDP-4-dehydrorhamnose 3,5-epimerase family protein [Klebsiella quasipneumoniae subsp. similipneumoniae]